MVPGFPRVNSPLIIARDRYCPGVSSRAIQGELSQGDTLESF